MYWYSSKGVSGDINIAIDRLLETLRFTKRFCVSGGSRSICSLTMKVFGLYYAVNPPGQNLLIQLRW